MDGGSVILGDVFTRPAEVAKDAFARSRSSSPATLFEGKFSSGKDGLVWNEDTSGAGSSVSFNSSEALIDLVAGTGATDYAIHQSKKYIPYEPGKSQFVALTGVLGADKAGVVRRMGTFDDRNGVFFELDGSTVSVVIRSDTTGSVVENRTEQANWNILKLDGTDHEAFDWSKAQIFVIDYQWLGVGRVRFGVFHGGHLHYIHEEDHVNELVAPFMARPELPVRYEIRNTASQASSTTLKQICATVISEGGVEAVRGSTFAAVTDLGSAVSISNTALTPLLSIRPIQTFNGKDNRVLIEPLLSNLLVGDGDVFWVLLYNPTLTGATTWTQQNAHSAVEFNRDATAVSGGIEILSGFVAGGNKAGGTISPEFKTKLSLSRGIDIADYDFLTLAARSLGNQNVDGYGCVVWKESR